jgi:tetratricopeptide (TPR) repeat protein
MNFDKTKAKRNAEKHLSQGKIRSAIEEYEQVVKHDPKDFGTLNMLGDLHAKSSNIKAAVKCYISVGDHYGNQGFAQKAIAVYNKISKLEPHSIEVMQKLAELYKQKGSPREARTHYIKVAEHFQNTGLKIEALAMWKEIAQLDPTNTEVFLHLAESYLAEGETDEALAAFTEAGARLANKGDHQSAIASFAKAMKIQSDDPKILAAFVKSKCALGLAEEAAEKLREILVDFPHSREIRFVLIDCLIDANNIAEAEKHVVKLVEMEPANYPKFLELAHIYLAYDDIVSTARTLSMSSEHVLIGGQAEEFHLLIQDVLAKDPDQLDVLRLLARYCSWQRDEAALRESLVRLAKVARDVDSVDDERAALLQLTMVMPQETAYADRLRELNELHGFEQTEEQDNLFDKQFLKNQADPSVPATAVFERNGNETETDFEHTAEPDGLDTGFAFAGEITEIEVLDEQENRAEETAPAGDDELRLQKEVDSIRFYIENGYAELAEKAIEDLRTEFGDRAELDTLNAELAAFASLASAEIHETVPAATSDIHATVPADVSDMHETVPAELSDIHATNGAGLAFEDFRTELGLEELDSADSSDYETHFNTAIAYQEMGLIEESIKEYQEAISLVTPNDGTRRFFSCANLLGHCFMQQNMPNLALRWFQRTLETPDLTAEEKQGLWYELAGAYEAEGDIENAGRYFEQVYAENVNFRDVSERVRSIAVNQ